MFLKKGGRVVCPTTFFFEETMGTFSLTTKVDNIGESNKLQIAKIYKSFNQDSITTIAPLTLTASESKLIDLTNSSFIIIALDEYGTENEVLDLTLDNGSGTLLMTNVSYYSSSVFNLNSINIVNNSTETVEIYVIY